MTSAAAMSTPVVLSRTQELIWAAQRLYPDAPLSNMANRFRLHGAVDADRLVRAFHRVVEECDVLRMTILPGGRPGETRAVVNKAPLATTNVIDLPIEELDRWTSERVAVPIRADRAMYDSVLIRHAAAEWTWWLDLHHVATDAWSSSLIFAATSAAYERLDAESDFGGTPVDLTDVIDGRFFDLGDARQVSGREATRAGVPEAPLAPYGERAASATHLQRSEVPLGADDWAALVAALDGEYRSLNRDLALLALAAMSLAIWVHRTDGRRQVAIDLPVHHRSAPSSKRIVGPRMEFASIDVEITPSDTHITMFKRVLRSIMTALSTAQPGQSRSDRSDIVVNVVTARYGDFAGIPTTRRWVRSDHGDPNQLIGCQLFESSEKGADIADRIRWEIEVNRGIALGDAARRLPEHLTALVRAIVAGPDAAVSGAAMVTDSELDELALLNPLPAARKLHATVHDKIAAQLRFAPDWVVAEHDGELCSAADFDRRAEQLAHWLLDHHVTVGRTVGVRMRRSIDVLVAIHGIMRSGGVFVLLDPDDPQARHDLIVADADMVLLLESLPAYAQADDRDEIGLASRASLPDVGLDDVAYVLYTSGSTGVPKGVPISHRGLADYLAFAVENYPLDSPTMALHSSLAFDLTITSVFVAMLTGGRTVVYAQDPIDALAAIAADPRIDAIKVTPSQLEILCRLAGRPLQLRTVIVGGEAFRRPQAVELAERCEHAVRIFNEYGPTEAVVGCMIHEWRPDLDLEIDVPIGHAAPGSAIAILDGFGQRSPAGSWGELYVRRPGMATEYLGRPELTSHHFVETALLDATAAGRWYRTGDRVRTVRPGVAVYGGRIDDQLKVNGFRLEPAEVEVALVAHPEVQSALVRVSVSASGAETLTAWYRSATGDDVDPDMLRRHVSAYVSDYAVPSAYVRVGDMPLAASAKVDVALLPAPQARHRSGRFVAPSNDTERMVAEIWAEVLDVERVSLDDDFFSIGGASLSAIEVVASIDDCLGTDLPDAALFEARTVRALALLVDRACLIGDPQRPRRAIPVLAPDELPPLSSSEEAMLFDYRSDPASTHYHVARLYRLDVAAGHDALDVARLRDAFRDVVAHHQPLHTAYDRDRTVLPVDQALTLCDVGEMDVADFDAHARRARAIPFDLDRGPLMRLDVAQTGPSSWGVLVCLHHISLGVGTLDLIWQQAADRYEGDSLPQLPVTYGAHAAWQRRRADESERAFWMERSRRRPEPAAVALPAPPPGTPDGYVARMLDIAPASLAVPGHTRFAAAFAAAGVALTRLTASSHVEFGIAATTKDHADVAHVIGHHLNSLPIALTVSADDTFAELLAQAGSEAAAAIGVRTYPFASMVRDARDNDLVVPDLRFMLAYDEMGTPRFPGAHVEQHILASEVAVTDVTIFVQERPGSVQLSVEYSGSVLAAEDAELLLATFEAVLLEGIQHPDASVAELVVDVVGSALVGDPLGAIDTTVLGSIAARIIADPAAAAVIDRDGHTLAGGELARRVAVLAQMVDAARSAPEDRPQSGRVGVAVGRSIDTVPAILGVQFAGAAYVPLDPTVGIERLSTIAAASEIDILLHDGSLADRLDDPDGSVLGVAAASCVVLPDWSTVELPTVDAAAAELVSRAVDVGNDDDAYVIFTSGSTGTPRGVVVSHRNLASSTAARSPWYGRVPERFLVTSSIGFDSSVVGLFWPLVSGGAVVMPGDDDVHDVDRLGEVIRRCSVSHVLMVPTLYRALLGRRVADLRDLDVVVVAGEACPAELIAEHVHALPSVGLVNEYGPTETTVWATAERLHDPSEPMRKVAEGFGPSAVPIGGPIPGVELLVVGDDLAPVAPRVAGELLISGSGVTDGYLGLAELTAQRFIVLEGRRWYRTGDRVRVVDGIAYFLGRLDDQLNVGGLRVEPSEIETILRRLPEIDDAVVVAVGTPMRLIAHVIGAESVDEVAVRGEVARHVTAAAVPSRVVRHDSLPRSANGKIDRLAAHELAVPLMKESVSADLGRSSGEWTDTGRFVVEAWRVALGRDDVRPDTDFFDAGGNSLAAVEIVTRLGDHLGMTIPIAMLLAGETPGGMTELVDEMIVVEDDEQPADVFQSIALRPGEADGPVVLMVPSWDDVFGYQALAATLPQHVLVVALACASGGQVATVAEFVDGTLGMAIDAVNSRSSVTVLGWSVGGVVAVELAVALARAGVGVDRIALVDTLFPGEGEHLWSNRWWKYKSLLRPKAAGEVAKELRAMVRRRTQRASAVLRRRFDSDSDVQQAISNRASGVFPPESLNHPLGPIELPVVFYAASATNPDRTVRRWIEIAEDFTVVPVKGRHRGFNSVMAEPGLGAIATDLLARMR